MYKLAIFSRDYSHYKSAFEAEKQRGNFHNIELIWANKNAENAPLNDINIAFGNPNLCADFIHECNNLAWFQSTWAGIKPLIEQSKRDYLLTGLKGVFGAQMREYVMAYILYFQRKVEKFKSSQSQKAWEQEVLPTLNNKIMGIMGLGSIGEDVANAAKAFGMQVYSLNARSTPTSADRHYFLDDLTQFAERCDFVVNLLPHTPETDGLCDAKFFNALKPGACFINGGRGNVLANDTDLVSSLKSGQLKAAVLDVFKQEPLPHEHPFWHVPNLYITNHTAASSQHHIVWEYFASNLGLFSDNKALKGVIDFNQGY
jgi:phosphoglycerate dehydrogenase-like enzyme